MSVRWVINERTSPVLLEARITLAFYIHEQALLGGVGFDSTVHSQMGFWNHLVRSTRLPDGRKAELGFSVRQRVMSPEESRLFDSMVTQMLGPGPEFPYRVPLIFLREQSRTRWGELVSRSARTPRIAED